MSPGVSREPPHSPTDIIAAKRNTNALITGSSFKVTARGPLLARHAARQGPRRKKTSRDVSGAASASRRPAMPSGAGQSQYPPEEEVREPDESCRAGFICCEKATDQTIKPLASWRNRRRTRLLAISTALALTPSSAATCEAVNPSTVWRWKACQVAGGKLRLDHLQQPTENEFIVLLIPDASDLARRVFELVELGSTACAGRDCLPRQ